MEMLLVGAPPRAKALAAMPVARMVAVRMLFFMKFSRA
jgi:hypothetical protein